MSTLHKVKAYFGMAPMEDYDDEYYEDDDRGAARGYSRRPRDDRFDDDGYGRSYEVATTTNRRPATAAATATRTVSSRGCEAHGTSTGRHRGSAHCAVRPAARSAMDPRRMATLFDEGSPLSKITTLRPKDYSEARTIGERFRDGTPVIMDLVSMDNADAKRLVDFAAGLALRAAWLVRQGRHQGLPALTGRYRRQRRGAQAHRRGWLLRLSVRPTGRNPAGQQRRVGWLRRAGTVALGDTGLDACIQCHTPAHSEVGSVGALLRDPGFRAVRLPGCC